MIKTLRDALKIKDIRTKLLYTFMALIIVRIGCQLPVPGVDRNYFASWFEQQTALNFFDAMTGGSFTQMSIFALNITPYITASIIIQLLTIAIPKLEEMQKEGEDGRKKIAEYTRYLTIGLALIESIAMSVGFGNQGLLEGGITFTNVTVIVVSMTAGSAFLMWLGERITEKGVGNGISIILLINIVSRIPNDLTSLYNQFIASATVVNKIIAAVVILAVILGMVVFIIVLQDGERRIPVQYAKKVQGRKMVGGQSSNIPLKVNTAGVIPVIFASSLMSFPIVIAQFMGVSPASGAGASLGQKILKIFNQSSWCNFSNIHEFKYTLGLVAYIVLVIFFAYFYTSVTFNPIEVSNNMKKQGGFIPGIRPGKPTTDYLTKVLNNIIFIGAVGLTIVAVVPIFFSGAFDASVSFSGTSLIIIVGVVLETMKKIESMMLVRHYKGFLND
ncbi:preprotein translocase subunit SecY [Velocimicrobium porci]|uniref:Protein translocase subunit SecY n=1 Tax=Velocimicrobium porci TaxID=2606634 RepID=A0A6L5XZA2_9FIRM|nr:preprotein translocase subunit SecY [Velocimicrobium porci]MSS64082.1 preprotein translocase subunit SecY [Velocimicrobium porci]